MKNVIITGIAGFIGSSFAKHYLEKNPDDNVIGVDDFSSGSISNLKHCGNATIIKADISQAGFYEAFPKGIDKIYHFAANTNTLDYSSSNQFKNLEMLQNILGISNMNENCPVIWMSSASIYGNTPAPFKKGGQKNPESPYAVSKFLCEGLVDKTTKANSDWKIITIRPFNVYGPNEESKGKMASMVYQIGRAISKGKVFNLFKDGTQKRDFIYIDDLIDLIEFCDKNIKSPFVLNGGTGQARSFMDVVDIWKNKYSDSGWIINWSESRVGHFQNLTQADTERSDFIGWKPKVTLEEGIEKMSKEWGAR